MDIDEGIMQTQSGAIGNRLSVARHGSRISRASLWQLVGSKAFVYALLIALSGCASQGDFLRLKEQVAVQHKTGQSGRDPFARVAQLAAEVDEMREEIRHLEGELELARKESADALVEIQRTRTTLAQTTLGQGAADAKPGSMPQAGRPAGAVSGSAPAAAPIAQPAEPTVDEELATYQKALDSWRANDYRACVEHFTGFLQTYPSSGYADDAAYWLADCTFKHDEFKRAVIRFSDVVRVYPDSPKAPDALYRQGESLLKLGPRFKDAARTVFKRVEVDYPDSDRAAEAANQLKRLGPSS